MSPQSRQDDRRLEMEDIQRGHARESTSVRGVVIFSGGLIVGLGLLLLALWGLSRLYADETQPGSTEAARTPLEHTTAPSTLADIAAIREALEHRQRQRLQNLDWVDEDAGIVSIPIDDAIDLIVEQGLPDFAPGIDGPEAEAGPGEAGAEQHPAAVGPHPEPISQGESGSEAPTLSGCRSAAVESGSGEGRCCKRASTQHAPTTATHISTVTPQLQTQHQMTDGSFHLLCSLLANASPRSFSLFPERAAQNAARIDSVFFVLLALSLSIIIFIFGLMLFFMIRYRAGSKASRRGQIRRTWPYEVGWISALLVISLALFVWGGNVYVDLNRAPDDAATWFVVGRQWMWEIQHPEGRRELNELHIPVGEPVRLVLTSEDVIHSFYIPAFRVKQDAVPGRYTSLWFTPTKPGVYRLFCAEYCGTDHSSMNGWVVVLEPGDYERWLINAPENPSPQPLDPTARVSFRELGCDACHRPDTAALSPILERTWGRTVHLQDGSTLIADEEYVRESIINPAEKVVRGYRAIMPTYQGLLTEPQLWQLINAVRALGEESSRADFEEVTPQREIEP